MPKLNEDEIKTKIADGSISGITVDTAIFDRYGRNLRYPLLRKLDQFRGGNVQVLISEVVCGEVKAHIAREAAETQRLLKKSIHDHAERWNLSDADRAVPNQFLGDANPEEAANQQFAEYMDAIAAEIVPFSTADISAEVMKRYFSSKSPFEPGEKKKYEFPDAFALVSLEFFGTQKRTLILCVSSDKGWLAFGEQSNHLVCVNDLSLALSFFNQSGRTTAERIIRLVKTGAAADVIEQIENAFEARLDEADFDVRCWSSVEVETEPVSAVVQRIDWDSASQPTVIAADDETVTFTTKLQARIGFSASFSFFVRDSVDGDYLSLGSEESYLEEEQDFELVLTVSRELPPDPDVIEAEIAKKHIEVDFGTVEPFQNENPYHEEY